MPLMVNSGTKAAMMISAENRMPWLTSEAASAITAGLPRSVLGGREGSGLAAISIRSAGGCDRRRKMLSIMITLASTIRPKSMAPTESRFALSPRRSSSAMAKASANGMVAATITAERRSPRNSSCSTKIRTTPSTMLCSTVWVVTRIKSERS